MKNTKGCNIDTEGDEGDNVQEHGNIYSKYSQDVDRVGNVNVGRQQ